MVDPALIEAILARAAAAPATDRIGRSKVLLRCLAPAGEPLPRHLAERLVAAHRAGQLTLARLDLPLADVAAYTVRDGLAEYHCLRV